MGVRKTRYGTYEFRFQHRGHQYSLSRDTRKEAIRDGAELRRQIEGGVKPATQPLREWLGEWIDSRTDLRPASIVSYRQAVRAYEPHPILNMALRDITPADVRSLVAHIATKVNAPGVRTYVAPIRAALSTAVDDGLLVQSPWRGISLPRDPRPEGPGKVLTPTQFSRLVDAAGKDAPQLRLMVATGIRVSEMFALRPVDVGEASVRIARQVEREGGFGPPKSGKARTVPIDPGLAAELKAGATDLVLLPNRQGRMWTYGSWRSSVWIPLMVRADIQGVRPHDLRHTAASWLLNRAGVDVKTVQEIMGHSRLEITARYLHTTPEHLSAAAAAMGRLVA